MSDKRATRVQSLPREHELLARASIVRIDLEVATARCEKTPACRYSAPNFNAS